MHITSDYKLRRVWKQNYAVAYLVMLDCWEKAFHKSVSKDVPLLNPFYLRSQPMSVNVMATVNMYWR